MQYYYSRFHNAAEERVIGRDVVTPICDDVQLSIEEYRERLYKVGVFHRMWALRSV